MQYHRIFAGKINNLGFEFESGGEIIKEGYQIQPTRQLTSFDNGSQFCMLVYDTSSIALNMTMGIAVIREFCLIHAKDRDGWLCQHSVSIQPIRKVTTFLKCIDTSAKHITTDNDFENECTCTFF